MAGNVPVTGDISMTIRTLVLKLASAFVLFVAFGTANAASISLSPAYVDGSPGDTFSLDVIMDFSDVTAIGGGFDVLFDSSGVTFVSWAAAGVGDPALAREPDVFDGLLSGIAVGDFVSGITGVQNLGTLTFQLDRSGVVKW